MFLLCLAPSVLIDLSEVNSCCVSGARNGLWGVDCCVRWSCFHSCHIPACFVKARLPTALMLLHRRSILGRAITFWPLLNSFKSSHSPILLLLTHKL